MKIVLLMIVLMWNNAILRETETWHEAIVAIKQ